jgi:hypothetical protein
LSNIFLHQQKNTNQNNLRDSLTEHGAFDFQNSKHWIEHYRTEQGRTRQDKIAPVRDTVRDREIIFFIFESKIGIFVFFIVVLWTKSCPVV